jgi:hypothetical protein
MLMFKLFLFFAILRICKLESVLCIYIIVSFTYMYCIYFCWQGYNIHINGTFHCTVRYRQLLSLHDQLRRELGPAAAETLPPFPPKHVWPLPLSPKQLEHRRAGIEKYIQTGIIFTYKVINKIFNQCSVLCKC